MQSSLDYRPEVDGLRALAVVAILLHHAGLTWLPGGYLGVDVFFVISGFVITRLAQAELAAGSFTLTGFWRRRMRRILPALVLMLVVCLALAWLLLTPSDMENFLPVFFGAAGMVPNIVLWNNIGYFAPEAGLKPLLHLWSLGVEEQFYLLYPLLLLAVWRRAPGRLRQVLFWLTLASFALAASLVPIAPTAGFYLLPPRAWELLAGGLAALSLWQPSLGRRQFLSLLGLGMVLLPMTFYQGFGSGLANLPPILGTFLCLLMARPDTWLGRALSWRPVVLVGKISFGAYLWHWPLLVFARIALAEEPALGTKLGLMLVALGLGWASWRFVETPFRRSEAPILPGWGIGAGLVSLAACLACGLFVLLAEARGWRDLTWPGYQPAALAALDEARGEFTRANVCHLPASDYPLPDFLANWDCNNEDMEGLTGWPVAVYGDSHAGDVAMTLRLSGLNPLHISAWGCSVIPSRMRSECRVMADMIRARAKERGITTLLLVNRWQASELTPEALVEMEIWWGEAFDRIVLFAPLPSFVRLEDRLPRWTRDRVAALEPSLANSTAFIAARKRTAGSEMLVVDPVPFFCGDRPGCTVIGEGPLMLDESGHLTVEGARLYGERLRQNGILQQIHP